MYAKSGDIRRIENNARYVFDDSGELVSIVGSLRDISRRKADEQKLISLVKEKKHVLSELNHRVKNNLNIVLSLIRLKEAELGERDDLGEIRNHIRTISYLHEKLSLSDAVDTIEIGEFLDDVLGGVFSFYSQRQVTIQTDVPPLELPTKLATTIGLIVTQLATNAVKHGFEPNSEARFVVTLEPTQDTLTITVFSSGRSLPSDFDIARASSLGISLIRALVDQLDGRVAVPRPPDPLFEIHVPRHPNLG